jgi:hypothetical protein
MFLPTSLALLLTLTYCLTSAATPHPISTFAILGASRLSSFSPHAQLSSQAPTYSLRGTVVNSVTGEAIRGALVQVYLGGQKALLTGPDGKFQFDALPAGQTSPNAQKPGFFTPQQITPSARPPLITVGPDSSPVTLKLVPEAILYGRISGDAGEPIESLPVKLFSERIENGQRVRRELRTIVTNEDGEFRVADLMPGGYFLFVGPSQAESFFAEASGRRAQGYPAFFYPGSPDLSSATPIAITAGKHEEINIAVTLQPFYRISGTVSRPSSVQRAGLQVFNAAGQSIGTGFRFDQENGTFQTQWLPAGLCTVTASAHDNKTQQAFSASASLNLASDLSGVHLAVVPGVTIPVSVRVETTHDNSSTAPSQGLVNSSSGFRGNSAQVNDVRAQVNLTPKDPMFSRMRYGSQVVQNAESHSLALSNVPAGTYSAEIFPNGPYYVQSATSGFTNLLREDLTVAPGGSVPPIQIVLRDDFASLEGKVSYDGQVESAVVIAIPEDAPRRSRNVAAYNPNGQFGLPQLAPGPYKVLAVDRLEGFEYANPEVLRKYLSKTRDVTLWPDQKASVNLEVVRVGE